jgi:hypothetical protein
VAKKSRLLRANPNPAPIWAAMRLFHVFVLSIVMLGLLLKIVTGSRTSSSIGSTRDVTHCKQGKAEGVELSQDAVERSLIGDTAVQGRDGHTVNVLGHRDPHPIEPIRIDIRDAALDLNLVYLSAIDPESAHPSSSSVSRRLVSAGSMFTIPRIPTGRDECIPRWNDEGNESGA